MKHALWLVPLLPFLGVLLNGVLLWKRIPKRLVGLIACGTVGLACLIGVGAVASYMASPEYAAHEPFEQVLYLWIPAGSLQLLDGSIADFEVELGAGRVQPPHSLSYLHD